MAEAAALTGSEPSSGKGDIWAALLILIRKEIRNEKTQLSVERKHAALLTIDALTQVAKAFAGVPGRKSIIWASTGFPYSLSSPTMLMCEPACPAEQRSDIQPVYDRFWRVMNDAQMSIYSVDLRSLAPNNFDVSKSSSTFTHPYDVGDKDFDRAAESRWQVADASNTLELFANNTGGKFFSNSNDLMRGFREAVADDSHYYVLGYYIQRGRVKPVWHKLSVDVRVKGARVRSRAGYFLEARTEDPRQNLRLALASPLNFTAIPISVSCSGIAPGSAPGKKKVEFDIVMPKDFPTIDEADKNHLLIDVAAVALSASGEVLGQFGEHLDRHLPPEASQQIEQNGMTYRAKLQLPPGEYTVRFAVLDLLVNRMGSVSMPMTIGP